MFRTDVLSDRSLEVLAERNYLCLIRETKILKSMFAIRH